jgi:filamentous hemagglutinin family protein
MNKTFHSVWNAKKQACVAAAETVSVKGKPSSGVKVAAVMTSLLGGLLTQAAHAQIAPLPNTLPTGGKVSAGQASISQSGANLVIQQSSNRAAINWQTFNLGKDAQVQFQQPSASSVTLNRVLSADPSQIFGRISANGQVILSNPAGVYFGKDARVDVGGLVATTHGMNDTDFMAGKNRYERNVTTGSTGSVVNEGELKAALGGYIALLAPEVRNQGAVIAHMGTVALAAGEAVDLKFDTNNRLTSIRVEPSQIAALVDNRHAVQAPGGLIIISAQSMDRLVGGVVKNSGRIEANGLQQQGGRIMLSASHKLENTGSITANATVGSTAAESGPAGRIEISAPQVTNSGSLSATGSSQHSAGSVLVQATQFTQTDTGRIDLSAPTQGGTLSIQTTGSVQLQGSVDVQATQYSTTTGTASQGGQISIAAQGDIALNNATLDASGGQGGRIQLRAKAPAQTDNPNPIPETPDAPGQGRLAMMGQSTLSTRGRNGQGGTQVLLGDHIELLGQTALNATGTAGGGNVLVGGDWQGGTNAERRVLADGNALPQATTVTMAEGVNIDASATEKGKGGTVVLWSDIHNPIAFTRAQGAIFARGGANGGDGGQIETSGATLLTDGVTGSAASPKGRAGDWLFDPYNYTIDASGASTIAGLLNGGTAVTIDAANASSSGLTGVNGTGNIAINSAISSTGAGALSLNAAGTMAIDANLSVSGGLNLTATGGIDLSANLTSAGNINVNSPLRLKVGQSSISSSAGNLTFAGTINSFDATTRALFLTATAGAIELNGAIGATRTLSYLGVNSAQGATFRGGALNLASGTIVQEQYGSYIVWDATPYYEALNIRYRSTTNVAVSEVTSAELRDGHSQLIWNNRAYDNYDNTCNTCGTVYPIGTLRITDSSGVTTVGGSSNSGSGIFNITAYINSTGRVYFDVSPSEPNRVDTGKTDSPYYPYGGNATLQIYQGTEVIGYRDVLVATAGQLNITGSFKFEAGAAASISNTISGTGSFIKAGAGALTLSGSNSFTGGTTLEAGTLALASSAALGNTGTIAFNGGALQYSANNNTDYSSRFANTALQHYKIDTNGQNVPFNTALQGVGSQLTKDGAGTLALTQANTYSGATTVNQGTLYVAGTLADTTTVTVASGATYTIGSSDTIASIAGSGTITTDAAGLRSLTVNNTSDAVFSGELKNGASNVLKLIKKGAGTLTLSGSANYTGGTQIDSGTLVLANDSPTFGSASFSGAGTLQIAPKSDDFSADLNITSWTGLSNTLGGLIIGKPSSVDGTTDRTITIATDLTIDGPISVYGGDIALSGTKKLSTTLSGAPVMLKASNNISSNFTDTSYALEHITTTGGNLTLWSDSDGSGAGNIQLKDGFLKSSGGRLTLAGGSTVDADGLPTGFATSSTYIGVNLSGNAQLTSGAGRLLIKGNSTHATYAGVSLKGSVLSSTGAIDIHGGTAGIVVGDTTALGDTSSTGANTGNITLTGDYIGKTSSSGAYTTNQWLKLYTSGWITLQPYSSSFFGTTAGTLRFDTSTSYVSARAAGLTLGKPGNLSNLEITGTSTPTTGTLTTYGSNLYIKAPLLASKVVLNASVDNALAEISGANGRITANQLLLRDFGTVSFNNNANNVIGTLAAQNVGRLYVQNNGALTVGSVTDKDSVVVDGITAREKIWLETITGDLTVGRNISTSYADPYSIDLVAGNTRAAGYTTGDNIVINPTYTITAGTQANPGRVLLYTGSLANSTGLAALVGSASGNFRYNSTRSTSNFTSALGSTGTYAIYREQPSVSLVGKNETIIYGDTPTLQTEMGGTPVNGDTWQMIGVSVTSQSGVYNAANTAAVAASDNGTALYDAGTYTLRPLSVAGGTTALGYGVTGGTGTLTVNKRTLTISGLTAADRAYDGTRTANITNWGSFSGGYLLSETVGLNTSAATAQFDSANAGDNVQVTATGFALTDGTNGGLASNYQVSAVGTAKITKAALSVSTSNITKTYDGGLSATGSPVVVVGSLFANVSNSGAVDTLSGGNYAFTDKNAGSSNKTVTVSDVTVNGGTNYDITYVNNNTSTINPANLVLSGTRAYDGGTTFAGQYLTATGVNNETFSVTGWGDASNLASKHVASNQALALSSVTGLSLGGSSNGGLANNYIALGTTGSSVTLTKLNANLSATDTTLTYNAQTQTQTAPTLSGFVSTDTIAVSGVASRRDMGTTASVLTTSSPDAANYNITYNNANLVIAPFNLTVTGANAVSKQYNRHVAAAITGGSLVGVFSGDTVTLNQEGTFTDWNVGTNKTVTSTSTLSGTHAGNYSLTQTTGLTANITAKPLTISGVAISNKVYDGSNSSTATNVGTLSGVITGDTVMPTATAAFSDKNVGANKTVTLSNFGLDGADAVNYSIAPDTTATTTANITARPLNVVYSGINKTYNRSANASVSTSDDRIAGDSFTINRTANFVDWNVGTAKLVNISGVSLSDGDAGNYTVASTASASANITAKAITIGGITASSKEYNSNTTALMDASTATGWIAGDSFLVNATGIFSDKHVGTSKVVTLTSAYSGTDVGNYSISDQASTTANITAKAITIGGITASSKEYNSNTTALMDATTATGWIAGDIFSVSATGTFSDKHVGTSKVVTLTSAYSGTDVGNYSISDQASTTADITAKAITISGITAANKVYNGGSDATVSVAGATGWIANDNFTVAANGTFADRHVGAGKAVNLNVSYSGADIGNYIVTVPTVTTADITAKAITIGGITASSKEYNSNTLAVVDATSATGWIAGDSFSVSATGTFSDKNVGTGKVVTLSSTYSGTDVGNYSISDQASTTANITAKAITIGGITASSKEYNSNTTALVDASTATGWIAGDIFSVSATGTFSDKHVGTSKVVTLTSAYSGTDVGNYSISDQASTTADITAKAITISGITAANKVYNGGTDATVSVASATGWIAGDNFTVTANGTFADRHVGAGKAVNLNVSYSGADIGNYIVTGPTSTAANITPKPVTLTPKVANRDYNSSSIYLATADDLVHLSSQLGVTGDGVAGATLVFDNKNVGSGKSLTATTVNLADGNNGGNYTVSLAANNNSSITRLSSVTWVGSNVGNWFNPANWAGGVVPDLANVANVVIPANVTVSFDTAGAPAGSQTGAVQLDSLGTAGSLTQSDGILQLGNGGMTLGAYIQSGGSLTNSGTTVVGSLTQSSGSFTGTRAMTVGNLTQTGGTLVATANLTVTDGFSQGGSGSIRVDGNTSITDTSGGIVLGNLETGGVFSVNSTDGDMTQAVSTSIQTHGNTMLTAAKAGAAAVVTLNNSTNDFGGTVTVTAGTTRLRDINALTAVLNTTGATTLEAGGNIAVSGSVSGAGGDLLLDSGGKVIFGALQVDRHLQSTMRGSGLTGGVSQTGALVIKGKAEFVADTGVDQDAYLTMANDFQGVVSFSNTRGGSWKNVSLNDINHITLGNINVGGDLVVTAGDDITQDKTPPNKIVIAGQTNITAGGDVVLDGKDDKFTKGVTVKARSYRITGDDQGAVEAATSAALYPVLVSTIPGTNLSSANAPQLLVMSSAPASSSSASSSGTSAAAASSANSSGVTVDMKSTSQQDTPTMVAVSLPKGASTVGTGFSFELPESVRSVAGDGLSVQVTRVDGSPLPAWLKFDQAILRFEANAVPDSALPMQVAMVIGGQRLLVVISERTE